MKHLFLDTNVIIDNVDCVDFLKSEYENCKVYIPYNVFNELDSLKRNNKVCNRIFRFINGLIERLDEVTILPQRFLKTNPFCQDDAILNEIIVYSKENAIENPILITNDKIFQIKAKLSGIQVEGFDIISNDIPLSQSYIGIVNVGEDTNGLYNYFMWENGTPVFYGKNVVKKIDYQHKVWNVKPKNVYQNLLFELLLNKDIDVVSIQSEAGKGKSFLVLATALYLTLEKKKYKKIYIIKPTIEIGKELGALPGPQSEKTAPFMMNIRDLVMKLHEIRPANKLFIDAQKENYEFNEKIIECMPINYMRGMNLDNAIVIIEEAQGFARFEMRTLLTRVGENCKVFITGDVRQIDNEKLNEFNNGLEMVVKHFLGLDNYAHFVLKGQSVRGKVCDMVLKTGL